MDHHVAQAAQEKSVLRWTNHVDMTIAVDWDVKNQTTIFFWERNSASEELIHTILLI